MNDKPYGWRKQTATQWKTLPKRSYTGTIDRTGGATPYTLTITGPGAPAPSTHKTLRIAQNAFRKFLHTKPVA